MSFTDKNKDELQRILLEVLIVLALVALLVLGWTMGLGAFKALIGSALGLVFPFVFAWFVSASVVPVIDKLAARLHIPRSLMIFFVLVCLVAFVALFTFLLIDVISDIIVVLSRYTSGVVQILPELPAMAETMLARLGVSISDVESWMGDLQKSAAGIAMSAATSLIGVLQGTPATLIAVIVALVATFYWCRDEAKIRNIICGLAPKNKDKVLNIYDGTSAALGGWVRAQAVLIACSITWCLIGFNIMRLPHAVTMSLLVGCLDCMPVVGPGTVLVTWGLWYLLTGKPIIGIALLGMYAFIVVFRNVMEPKLLGDQIGLHPLATLAALFIGLKTFGIIGLIGFPIVLSLIVTVRYKTKQQEAQAAAAQG